MEVVEEFSLVTLVPALLPSVVYSISERAFNITICEWILEMWHIPGLNGPKLCMFISKLISYDPGVTRNPCYPCTDFRGAVQIRKSCALKICPPPPWNSRATFLPPLGSCALKFCPPHLRPQYINMEIYLKVL